MVSRKMSESTEDHNFNKADVRLRVKYLRAHDGFLDLNRFPGVCLSKKDNEGVQ